MEIQKAYYSLQKRMASALTDEDHFIEFQRLHTDEERVKFTLDLMVKYDILPNVCPATKNANESEKLRTLGNNIFVSKSLTNPSYEQALELYTKSIAYAPYPSEQLTLAYANRSAALFKLKKYEECIRDIDRALALNYPDYLKAKIYIRKIECLEALEHPNIDNGIKEAQQWLDKMPLNCDYCKKLKETLISKDKMPKLCNSKRQTDAKHKTKYTFPEIKTPNTEIPCASDAICIKYNKQYGRHLVATRKIDPGEVIAIEKAYSTLYCLDNMYTHCSYCLIPCWSNIPCNYCPYSMYCSEECKTLDWEKYHDMECSVIPFMFKLDFSTTELFSVRIAVQAVKESPSIRELRQELREVDTCNDPRTKGFSKKGTFENDKYRSLYSLETNSEKYSTDYMFSRCLGTCFILYYLATHSNLFGSPLKKDMSALVQNTDVTFIGGLILKHQLMLSCNAHDITGYREVEPFSHGSAIISFYSLINHSCNPNVFKQLRSGHMIMYAICPIEKDEQIFDCYDQFYADIPKVERQECLLENYLFTCNCLPCREDWPLFDDMKPSTNLNEAVKRKVAKVEERWRLLMASDSNEDVLNELNVLDDAIKMIKILHYQAPRPSREMCIMVEALKWCLLYEKD